MQLLPLILTLLVAANGGVLCTQVTYKSCGSNVGGEIVSVDVHPCDDPLVCSLRLGQKFHLKVTFIPEVDSSAVKSVGEVVIRGVPIILPELTDPDVSGKLTPTTPLKAGTPVVYSTDVDINDELPRLAMVLRWRLFDPADNVVACLMLRTRVVS